MKKFIVFFLIMFLCLLNGCDKKRKENATNSAINVNMQITAEYSKELVVPDPESSEEEVSVVMRYIPDFEKYEAYEDMDKCYKSCEVDLSYLGFKNKMTILAFQIGAVTSYTYEYIHIEYEIPNGYLYDEELPVLINREVYANCLVLVAKDSLKEDENNYIIVLDYDKKKSYVIKTSIWNPI